MLPGVPSKDIGSPLVMLDVDGVIDRRFFGFSYYNLGRDAGSGPAACTWLADRPEHRPLDGRGEGIFGRGLWARPLAWRSMEAMSLTRPGNAGRC